MRRSGVEQLTLGSRSNFPAIFFSLWTLIPSRKHFLLKGEEALHYPASNRRFTSTISSEIYRRSFQMHPSFLCSTSTVPIAGPSKSDGVRCRSICSGLPESHFFLFVVPRRHACHTFGDLFPCQQPFNISIQHIGNSRNGGSGSISFPRRSWPELSLPRRLREKKSVSGNHYLLSSIPRYFYFIFVSFLLRLCFGAGDQHKDIIPDGPSSSKLVFCF